MIEFRSISKSAAIHHDALCFAAPKMAEYMMDRAKELYRTKNWISSTREEEDEEYRRILSILKDAGIEVVEK